MMSIPSLLVPFETVQGVYTVPLKQYGDARGSFAETFRREWFPMVNWNALQMNRSISKAGVLRGLHYHFNQVDYWLLLEGRIRVGLADLRVNSPTYARGATIDLDADDPTGVFIPIGVAHGFYALTDITLMYVVNQYYNGGADEHGVAWNDPTFNVAWGVDAPILSDRDRNNPLIKDIPADKLPE
jgi:dTDP-4-dehydrorhamnose 3,5-epimerase